jgi:hypothetical protein
VLLLSTAKGNERLLMTLKTLLLVEVMQISMLWLALWESVEEVDATISLSTVDAGDHFAVEVGAGVSARVGSRC